MVGSVAISDPSGPPATDGGAATRNHQDTADDLSQPPGEPTMQRGGQGRAPDHRLGGQSAKCSAADGLIRPMAALNVLLVVIAPAAAHLTWWEATLNALLVVIALAAAYLRWWEATYARRAYPRLAVVAYFLIAALIGGLVSWLLQGAFSRLVDIGSWGRIILAALGFGAGLFGFANICLGSSLVYGFLRPSAALSFWFVIPALLGIYAGILLRLPLRDRQRRRDLDEIGEGFSARMHEDDPEVYAQRTEHIVRSASRPTMTIFAAPGESGWQLAEKMQAIGYELTFNATISTEYTPRAGMRACFCDDVVVFDLTATPEQAATYRALPSHYTFCDHALIVSRTPLPLNLLPVRAGGAPAYPYPVIKLPDGTPVRFPDFTIFGGPSREWIEEGDHSILHWLRAQLEDLRCRPLGRRLPLKPSFRPLWPLSLEVWRFMGEMSQQHYSQRVENRVFVSYRTHAYDNALKLAASASRGDFGGVGAKDLRIVSPSELAMERELLSAGRRWMVLSFLRMLIRNAPEFWVYRTDDYLMSWWTLAELVMAAVISNDKKFVPRMRIYDSADQRLIDDVATFRIRMTCRQRSLINQFVIETSPGVTPTGARTETPARTPRLPRRGVLQITGMPFGTSCWLTGGYYKAKVSLTSQLLKPSWTLSSTWFGWILARFQRRVKEPSGPPMGPVCG